MKWAINQCQFHRQLIIACAKSQIFFASAQGQLFHGSIYIITGLRDLQNNVKNVAAIPLCEHLKSFS